MKILLTAINARYIHSSLALRYLEKVCRPIIDELVIEEYTINDRLDSITASIYQTKADVVAFSCYIWNISIIIEVAERLKKVKPEVVIILGGPEVSYNPLEIIETYPYIDYVISGEGESALPELLTYLKNKGTIRDKEITRDKVVNSDKWLALQQISGLAYHQSGEKGALLNQIEEPLCQLDSLPSPYTLNDIKTLRERNKIIYYETSRGCPFSCSYCLSSTLKSVRNFPLERVKQELKLFIEEEVSLVKFVDRTFNADKKRALQIFKFLVDNRRKTRFHFEIAADRLNDQLIDFLLTVPPDLFQFEIGVQSTNLHSLELIDRKMNFKQLKNNVIRLREAGNIDLHLDLIAGLPAEDLESFSSSFNDVYQLQPHALQLGFLKLLKGTKIRQERDRYDYQYTSTPPYEVLQNSSLTYGELLQIKAVEEMVDRYYNSGIFGKTLQFLLNNYYQSPFQFYQELADYYKRTALDRRAHSRPALYDILYDFFTAEIDSDNQQFKDYLKFDLVLNNQGVKLPGWAEEDALPEFKEICYQFLNSKENIEKMMPHFSHLRPGKILRQVRFEVFSTNVLEDGGAQRIVLLFDYHQGQVHNITDII